MQEDAGKLVLRLAIGGLILVHGIHKLLTGVGVVQDILGGHNLPDWLAYGVYLGEILGPILVIVGIFTRIGAALMLFNMILAVALAGASALLSLNQMGGYALEIEAAFLFGSLAILLLGAGALSVGGVAGRWN